MSTAAAPPAARVAATHPAGQPMAHRQILEAMSGLLLGMFVAILSSTVVSNALPVIVPDLGGSESGYTWVVTASLLATTISTPIWGKLSDLFSKKLLVQIALVIFVVSSAVAGLSVNMAMLITCRVFQGLGAGGLTALAQVILAAIIAPRERGRYSGYLGATFALATVGGPLVGGALTEHLSWHWCFYVGVPFAVAASIVLQKTLHLPVVKRRVKIDYLGALLISAGVSCLLIWVSLAGNQFAWRSWQTVAMTGGGFVLLALAVVVEARSAEPIIPLDLFRIPTVTLSALASLFVGVAMFGGTIFLSQYFQLARGESPTTSGVLTLPMILGLFVSSTVAGQFITRTGRWKGWIIAGGVLLTAGLGLMSTVEWDTDYWVVAPYMALIGLGVGMMMQNLVLAVQNVVAPQQLGTSSSLIAFTRTLGGAIGVSALGAVLNNRVSHHLVDGLRAAGIDPAQASGVSGGGVPDLAKIPQPVRTVVQSAFGSGVGDIFLAAAPFALLAVLISFFFKEIALRGSVDSVPATSPQHLDPSQQPAGTAVEQTPAREREVPPSGLVLSGTVRQDAGRAFAGAVVTLTDITGQQVARTTSDADGRYAMALLTGGTYVLIVAAQHVQPSASSVVVRDRPVTKDVTLSGSSSLAGRVLSRRRTPAMSGGSTPPAVDGTLEGVQDAVITLTDIRGEVVGSTTTDEHGGYAFSQLVGGPYVLTVQSTGRRPLARAVFVPDAGQLTCDLPLSAGGRVAGTVVAASDGRRLPEASVTLVDAGGAVVASALTGPDGSYGFDDLPSGAYTLTAAGYAPVATPVRVQDDQVASAQFRLGGDR